MVSSQQPVSPIITKAARMLVPLGLVSALAVMGTISVWWLVWEPTQDRLLRAQVAYEKAQKTEGRLRAARTTQEALRRVWAQLPAREEFTALALAISELAKKEQVDVPGMTYGLQKVEDGLPVKASLSFRAEGEYADIRRFIHRLETSGSYLVVESLGASTRAGESSDGRSRTATRVVFNVKVATFLLADQVPTQGAT